MINLKNLSAKENKALCEYETILRKSFPKRFKKLVLFGSKARDDGYRNSDIDLLVVTANKNRKTTRKIIELTHEPIAKFLVDLSPIVVEEEFFNHWSPLLAQIKRDGILLWTNKKNKPSI